jgi:hypothetical protein
MPQIPKRAIKRKDRRRGRVVSPESESDDDLHRDPTGSDGSNVGAVHFEPEDLSDEDESPRRPTAVRRTLRVRAASSNSDEGNKSVTHSVQPSKNKAQRKSGRFGKRKQIEDDSEAEDEVQPKKRKFVKGIRPSSSEEDEDFLDELDEHREHLPYHVGPGNVLCVQILLSLVYEPVARKQLFRRTWRDSKVSWLILRE